MLPLDLRVYLMWKRPWRPKCHRPRRSGPPGFFPVSRRASPPLSTSLSISSLVLCSIQLILSILRHIHISKASNLSISSFLIVHVSDPYNTTLHIIDLIIRFFRFLFSFPLSNSFPL